VGVPECPYNLGAFTIHRTALGALHNSHATEASGFREEFNAGDLSLSFQEAEHCLPVMAKSPIHCVVGGALSLGTNTLTISSDGGNCKISSPNLRFDPQNRSATVLGAYTDGHAVGTATMLLGDTRDHARYMEEQIGVPNHQNNATVAIECLLNVAAGIEFRIVNLDSGKRRISGAVSSSTCSPLDANGNDILLETFLTMEALATMAAGSWQPLAGNYFDDGWPATLHRTATQSFANATNYYFNDSSNPLEDALGLASVITMGDFYGTAHGDEGKSGVEILGGKFKKTVVRIGSGDAGTKRIVVSHLVL
jgi:hypothetical protein